MSYTAARHSLARFWNHLEETGEVAILRRRGHKDLAVIDADELDALEETAHLLRSPSTALRLLVALNRALGETNQSMPLDKLRSDLDLEQES